MELDVATDRPTDGCPIGSYGCQDDKCLNTCFCENHCSWKKCKHKSPPQWCLVHTKSGWNYDSRTHSWRAGVKGICRNK